MFKLRNLTTSLISNLLLHIVQKEKIAAKIAGVKGPLIYLLQTASTIPVA